MGANHNYKYNTSKNRFVVSNVPKILKWEQITTECYPTNLYIGCFQCSKDTKMGANHNLYRDLDTAGGVVSNVPKILKWEQITTRGL